MQFGSNRELNPYLPPAAATDVYGQPPDPDDLVLADRGQRFFAQFADGMLSLVALVPAMVIGGATENVQAAVAAGGLLWLVVLSYQWYLVSTTGQTLGKRWLGIKIVRRDGAPVDFVSGVLVRIWAMYALGAIPGAGPIIGLVDSLMIFSNERECLHDKLAGTKVVQAMPTRY